ncbi:MAG TPA: YicC/YloC family endoribonuclease [Syntrophales bacterium]|nr:YicC/YloC family endoribonuclease [Syntrophales bacterium]
MIQSMTGYGRTEDVLNGRRYTVEIKSLNHRYLETSVRLPAIISSLELEIKKKISGGLSRGRIELNVRMESEYGSTNDGRYELNLPLIRNYYELLKQLREELGLKEEITLNMVAGFRDAFVLKEPDLDLSVIWKELDVVVAKAMDALVEMRKKEGEIICHDLIFRIDLIMKSLDSIESRAPQVIIEYRKRLGDRVKELTGGIVVDDLRLSQEVAIMAEKSDIMEEIVRLKSHIIQFGDLLKGNDAVGRNIDFLIQEMVREINTIGSKSSDAGISKMVIDIKSELARIREQAQNIE